MSDKIHAEVWLNCECGAKIGGTIVYPKFEFTCTTRSETGVICGMTHTGEIKVIEKTAGFVGSRGWPNAETQGEYFGRE